MKLDAKQVTDKKDPELIYQAFLDTRTLAFQQCVGCLSAFFPPRVLCPKCGDSEYSWVQSSGLGTVYSVTRLAPRDSPEYDVILVDLDTGPRMMSNWDSSIGNHAVIGKRVDVVFDERDGATVPLFRPEFNADD